MDQPATGPRKDDLPEIDLPWRSDVFAGTMTTLPAFTEHRNSNQRKTGMPKEAHTKAAEHHESAAKSHRTAAEHHGKGEHAKGQEESTKAQGHSKTAREHSETAHGKSQSHK
jgi:hypothetical protein